MTRHRKSSHPKMGEGQSMHKGTEQHGWSPDVDQTEQQKNESARRSFRPEEYAPEKGRGEKGRGKESGGQEKVPPASEVKSETRSGERRAADTDEKGMRDMGPKGPSRRPSGGRDAEAHTGVDPQDP
ncbi:hypothetical protein ACWCO0_04680 [Streptomyces tubercidicus]|uniref:Uncharacterized protein n=1 Tax=Streptomyces tubercidicus TaxID=47759 RepID=A0A640UZ13_9ACTN|nr:hypothetical protein [Streptomyces tubercidicus]WAU15471.1 hypothetical protein STRTU_006194 [Streptomyces tubercidicus]GFE41333.1 hypothetical protein Stube_60060 [Streptomyces tubercidicus]